MYKILSLDGGGTWAMLQVLTLQARYKNTPDITGHQILKEYDMVIANSGGSLVLAALAEDWTLDKALGPFLKTPKPVKISFSKTHFGANFGQSS